MKMESKDVFKRLNEWYFTSPGKALGKAEKICLDKILSGIVGDYLLELGAFVDISSLSINGIQNSIYLAAEIDPDSPKEIFVCGNHYELPFFNDTIDAVLATHLIEFVDNPYLALEEIFHTLVPSGKLIIIGFNPYSLWGLSKLIKGKGLGSIPWCGRFVNSWRLRSWLLQLGFSILEYKTFYFRPPLKNSFFLKCCNFFEKLGKFIFPYFGGCYVLVAEKKLLAMTSLKEKKIVEDRLPIGVYVRPTSSMVSNEKNEHQG